ncbi:MAG: hypothetical protein ABH851_03875 [Methanobacteriota archaeon]
MRTQEVLDKIIEQFAQEKDVGIEAYNFTWMSEKLWTMNDNNMIQTNHVKIFTIGRGTVLDKANLVAHMVSTIHKKIIEDLGVKYIEDFYNIANLMIERMKVLHNDSSIRCFQEGKNEEKNENQE